MNGTNERVDEAQDGGGELPVFYYDDCCPLCRGYTAVLSGMGLAGRQGFSTIEHQAMADLDFDRARHQIPLRNAETGEVRYGLDGILGLVAGRYRLLAPVVRFRPVRRVLDGLYWFITYNRRHIVTAQAPANGVDCAPDFHRPAVLAYLAFCAVVASGLAIVSGVWPAVLGGLVAGLVLIARRRPEHGVNSYQALGHVGSVAVASAYIGTVATVLTTMVGAAGTTALAAGLVGAGVTAARKLWLRRWMVRSPG